MNAHYMDGGLHHRSSRVASNNDPRPANINNINNGSTNMVRPSRLFHSYNPYHGNRPNNNNSGGKFTISISRALQCIFLVLIIGYVSLLLYTHALWSHTDSNDVNANDNHLTHGVDGWNNNAQQQQQQINSGGVRSSLSNRDGYKEHSRYNNIDNGKVVGNDDDDATSNSVDQATNEQQEQQYDDYRITSLHDVFFRTRQRQRKKKRSSSSRSSKETSRQPPPEIPFAFDTSRQHHYHSTEKDVPSKSVVSNNNVRNGNQQYYLDKAKREQKERRQNRKRRTTPPLPSSTQQESQDAPPIWYNLDHSSYNTVSINQKRWEINNNHDGYNTASSPQLDTNTILCGKYAQQASYNHPQNYYHPPSLSSSTTTHQPLPLNSQSKVLITGILSPLGFHLTLALHRQCNITNFIGIDSQMPNDPLSRLEMQDRLEVLLDELSTTTTNTNGKKESSSSSGKSLWHVPFLGLESKHPAKNEPRWRVEERERREKLLVKMRRFSHGSIVDHDVYEKYGIPPSPGVNKDGYGTLDLIAEYRPTHIVHLAGTQSDSLLNSKRYYDPQKKKTEGEGDDDGESSISSRPHLYELRMGMVGMEQLLSSAVAQTMIPPPPSESLSGNTALRTTPPPPHVVYASSYDARYYSETSKRLTSQQQHHNNNRNKEIMLGEEEQLTNRKHHVPPRGFHGVSHLIDEILASTYHGLHGLQAIGLRFDAIYGPRGFGVPSTSVPILNVNRMRKNVGVSPDVALAEVEVRRMYRKWMRMVVEEYEEEEESSLMEESGWLHASHHPRDFVFVEDAVGAIMAAMQYRAVQGSHPTTFNIGSGEMNTLSAFADKIQQVAFDDKRPNKSVSKSVIDVERSNAARSAGFTSNEYLGWSAQTTLKDGVAKLLAWHLDRALPFFPSSTLDEEEVDYSESEGVMKHMDGKDLLSKNNVESCSTQEGDATCLLEQHTSYPCASECSTMTCTSSIFDAVLPIVHDTTEGCYMVLYTAPLGYDVESLDVETEYSDSGSTFEYHEGTVCTIAFVPSESTLVKNVIEDLPVNAQSMLDTSPSDSYSTKLKKLNGHLAHKGFLLIFVDGATHPLSPEVTLLPKLAPARLFHSSVRRAMYVDESFSHTPYPEDALFLSTETYRGVTKSRTIKGHDEKGRETKYKLPEEPQRYAVMLASQMRDISTGEGHTVSLRDATRAMMDEKGYESDAHEPKEVRAQREFYERGRALINSMQLRSSDPAHRHKIEIKDFIRSKWVLYNLKLEEGHHVRCEWYKEHGRWAGSNTLDSGMDHLSFAYVMAKRELSRKIVSEEPLPKELSLTEKVIKAATDAHEWHPVFLGGGSKIPLHDSFKASAAQAIPLNIADRPEFELDKVVPETVSLDTKTSYFVRIMSDEVMLKARKNWAKFIAKFEKH